MITYPAKTIWPKREVNVIILITMQEKAPPHYIQYFSAEWKSRLGSSYLRLFDPVSKSRKFHNRVFCQDSFFGLRVKRNLDKTNTRTAVINRRPFTSRVAENNLESIISYSPSLFYKKISLLKFLPVLMEKNKY